MSLVGNERTKLSATTLSNIGTASIVAGFITPIVAVSFDVPGSASRGFLMTSGVAVAWLLSASAYISWRADSSGGSRSDPGPILPFSRPGARALRRLGDLVMVGGLKSR